MEIIIKIPSIKNIFFSNHSLKQTIFKNTFWLTLGTGVSKLFNFVLLIYVARILGAAEYGKFSFALAFVSLFTVVADLGISTILVRELSKEKAQKDELYSVISLKMILACFMVLLVMIGSLFITQDFFIRKIIFILSLFAITNTFIDLMYAIFQARQKMEHQAGAAILGSVLLSVFSFFILLRMPSAENLSYAYFSANIIALLLIMFFFHLKVMPLKILWNKSIWRKFLMISWPLAFTALFGLLYSYIDSVMLGYFGQMQETGWYNAAYRIAWMGYIFTGLVVTSFYPILSKYFEESKEKLQHAWNYQMDLMVILSFPLMAGGAVLSEKIINFVYGIEFFSSILALQILLVTVGILLLYAPFYQMLIVANCQRKIFWITCLGAIINIILNLLLIPKYSLYGSAIATVIAQFVIFVLLFFSTLRYVQIKISYSRYLIILSGVFLSTAAMVFVLSRLEGYFSPILLLVFIGIIFYFVVLFGLNYFTRRFKIIKQDFKFFYEK